MILLLACLGILVGSGCAALLAGRSAKLATAIGATGAVAGCALGLIPALHALSGSAPEIIRLPWSVPVGSFAVALDSLSAFFLLPLFALSACAAVYGAGYWEPSRTTRHLGVAWFFFNLLVAGMAMVFIAHDGMLFLMAWEVMSIASFFLVTFEDEHESVREAGWTYLIATHLGTAFLFVLFLLAGRDGSLDFDSFGPQHGASLMFVLALVGFGTKAGFMPLHVWLPEAHPAAPSPISALMSGIMIKTGIYGLVRIVTYLGPPPIWWGWTLVIIGLSSGILGVLYAIAQRDLKRLLAYSSVENIGIIALGLGLGLLGLAYHNSTLAALGFAGALLHVLNHALFKGLLFLGAGSVLHATGTRAMDHFGGLLKKMPATGATFLIGAVAIAGLPPLNGFVGEFLIFFGALSAHEAWVPAAGALAGLALIGGLAAACFTRAFGIVFAGAPRTEEAEHAHESGWAMRAPMIALAAGCVAIGLLSPSVVDGLAPVIASASGLATDSVRSELAVATGPLSAVSLAAIAVLALVAGLAQARRMLLRGRTVAQSPTWDCGYARPTARMQYTSSSFADPLTSLFASVVHTTRTLTPPTGYFPENAKLATDTPDMFRNEMYSPAFGGIDRVLARFRWLQHGRIHLYVLYIALTLALLLIWTLEHP